MQIKFTDEERAYLLSLVANLVSVAPNRETRRNLTRVGKKFEPSAQTFYLKPRDRAFLLNLMQTGEKLIQAQIAKAEANAELKLQNPTAEIEEQDPSVAGRLSELKALLTSCTVKLSA